jgi:predicted PhzF superfamily epimerase YddE/YHI9
MQIPVYQVDAFTSTLFHGNPAAICPLTAWLDDSLMQAIAAENNLAETAFLVPLPDGRFHLRWFTPALEIDLCGHATVAAAYVLCEVLGHPGEVIRFLSRSGELPVQRQGSRYILDFPSRPGKRVDDVDGAIARALGAPPVEMLAARDHLAVYETAEQVAALEPDFLALARTEAFSVIATAPAINGIDFVSRFFAPKAGVNEDPVTGSAHCTLIPYWSRRLGKMELRAKQISPRGGDLWCADRGDRVDIGGEAVHFLSGFIHL